MIIKDYIFTAENCMGIADSWEFRLLGTEDSNLLLTQAESEPFIMALMADAGICDTEAHLQSLMADVEMGRSARLYPIEIGTYELYEVEGLGYIFCHRGRIKMNGNDVENIMKRLPLMDEVK